jgi:hypothetical protein
MSTDKTNRNTAQMGTLMSGRKCFIARTNSDNRVGTGFKPAPTLVRIDIYPKQDAWVTLRANGGGCGNFCLDCG